MPARRSLAAARLKSAACDAYRQLLETVPDVLDHIDLDHPLAELTDNSIDKALTWNRWMRQFRATCEAAGLDDRSKSLVTALARVVRSVKKHNAESQAEIESASRMVPVMDSLRRETTQHWPPLLAGASLDLMRTHSAVFRNGYMRLNSATPSEQERRRILAATVVVWDELERVGMLDFCDQHEEQLWAMAAIEGLPAIDDAIEPRDEFLARARQKAKRVSGKKSKEKRAPKTLPSESKKTDWFLVCRGGLKVTIDCVWGSFCLMLPSANPVGSELVGSALSVLDGISDIRDGMQGKV